MIGARPGAAGPRSDARDLLQRVRRIELATRRAVEDTLSGQYHSVFKGRGMAFSEVRPYAPGDEVRSIDWNVSARTGQLHVKRFVEERELTVMILCDLSASTDFGSRERTKADVAAEIAALLALSAVANGDRVGLVLFTDRVERAVPPRKGRRHALRLVSEILQFRPRSRGTSVGTALEYLRRALRRRTVAFLLSDFVEGAGGAPPYERALRIAARKHDVVPIRISDRLEAELPTSGLAWIEDPETGTVSRVDLADRRVRRGLADALRADDEALRKLFARLELDPVHVRADDADYVSPLLAFFRARARRFG
ncbi:DUF58 domain-containing protein [Anaeromyxobacter oryzisoli]|uniref:DUF58 domain-containing protein n=1 Tax=Anaeromyxobacter oryzisoli TaxID=2925408 RepID=UPI001F57B831|nr:DUF58 domain-containing protein [Anaeromyxobacter sp. SG63]